MRRAIAVVVILVGSDIARADELSEHEAITRVVSRSPLIDMLEGAAVAEEGRGQVAGAYPNPEITYAREHTFGAAGTAETYLSVAQTIDLGGRRRLHVEAATLRAKAIRLDGDAERLAIAALARIRFFELLYRQEAVKALGRWVAHVGDALAIVTKREKRGDAATYDRRRLEREQTVTSGRMATEQAELELAKARLAALLGGIPSPVATGFLLPDETPPLDAIRTRSTGRPDLVALDLRVDAAARDRSAVSRWWLPDLRLELGWKGVNPGVGDRSDGYLAGASLSFPLWDRSTGFVRVADGEARAARGRRALLESELAGELAGTHTEVTLRRTTAIEFRKRTSSISKDLVHMTTLGYEAGELGVIELLDAYRGEAEDEEIALDMDLAARRARIELDRMTGAALP